jgi:hypothetical protein
MPAIDMEFSYEEDRHLYRNRHGIVRPSVTESLKAQGIFDFSRVKPDVLENARRRGKNVHKWCAEYDTYHFCDETWMAEDEVGYYDAWLRFRREVKPQIIDVERPMLGLIGGIEVGGTPDVIAWIGAWRWIIDRKCCASKHPGWALQLADYVMLKTQRSRCDGWGRMSVQLFPTGDYSLAVYEDSRDADVALAAVVLTEWDGQASDYNSDHARDTLQAWMHNHNLKAA